MTPFERDLSRALDDYLGPRRPVDARAISRAAIQAPKSASLNLPRLGGVRRLIWFGLVMLSLVALLGLAIGFGYEQPRPTPAPPSIPTSNNPAVVLKPVTTPNATRSTSSPRAVPTFNSHLASPTASAEPYLDVLQTEATAGPLPDVEPVSGPYELVIASSEPGTGFTEISVVGRDGERLVASIPNPAVVDSCNEDNGNVSLTGWLAHLASIGNQCVVQLYDLSNPSEPPVVITTGGVDSSGPVWGPNGLLAVYGGNAAFDPSTQSVFVPVGTLPDTEIAPSWMADGSGFIDPLGPGGPGVMPFRGAYEVGMQQTSDRSINADGDASCGFWMAWGNNHVDCSLASFGPTVAGPFVDWTLSFSKPRVSADSAEFANDGRSLWTTAQFGNATDDIHILELSGPGQIVTDTPVPVDQASLVSSFGISPDQSAFTLGPTQLAVGPHISKRLYVPGDKSPPVVLDGWPAGWVPKALADSWPTVTP